MTSLTVQWTAKLVGNDYDQDDLLLANAPASTDKLEISASIYSLYVYASWTFVSPASLMESGRLAVGNIIHFDFFPQDGAVYSYDLAILSVLNGPGSNPSTLGEVFNLTLISPWYFQQTLKSKAYKGGASSIIQQLVDEDLPDAFSGVHLTPTTDIELTVRYRTIQTPGRFIESRLWSILRGTNNTTPYLFTNLKNELVLIDAPALANTKLFTAISLKSPRIGTYQSLLSNSSFAPQFVHPLGLTVSVNNGPGKQLWHLTSPGILFLYHADGSVNTTDVMPILQALTHDVKNPYTFVSASKPVGLTKVYSDDSFNNYGDILSETINAYSKDLMDSLSVNLTCYPNLNMDVGRRCYLDLLDGSTDTDSKLCQTYLTRTVSHVFQAFKGATHVELSLPALSYTKPETVKNLFHL